MSARSLPKLLRGVLLAGAGLGTGSCAVTSCPDDGVEPPLVRVAAVEPELANGGPLTAAECAAVCDPALQVVTCVRETEEQVLCLQRPAPCEGRRPAGLVLAATSAKSPLLCHLRDAAALEAASVVAFRVLRSELARARAPRSLLRRASRAARDERRHARIAGALARRFGATVHPPVHASPARRSLEAMALENAVEGCVRETWGALVALHQAEHATSLDVQRAMRRIARDEVRHAELAWAVHRFAVRRLPGPARERLIAARARAIAELRREVTSPMPDAERRLLGMPSPEAATNLLTLLEGALWAKKDA